MRYFSLFFCIISMLAFVGCGDDDPMSSVSEQGITAPAGKLTVSATRAGGYAGRTALMLFHAAERRAMHARDAAAWAALFTPNAVSDYVPANAPIQGQEAIQEFIQGLFDSDYECVSERMFLAGEIMVTEHVTNSVDTPGLGMPGTGNPILDHPHIDIWEFEGNRVSRLATYTDVASMLMKVGVLPASELPPLVPSSPLPDPEPNGLSPARAVREYIDRWNVHDLAGCAKMMKKDAAVFMAPLGIPMDADMFHAFSELSFMTYSDLVVEIVRLVDLGDGYVLVEIMFKGTNDGPVSETVPATGKTIETRGATIYRVNGDGIITEKRSYWDEMTSMMQLGLVPAP